MVDWQVTGTSIYCDVVKANVIIMVYKDWSMKCVGYKKYSKEFTKNTDKILMGKGKKPGSELRCDGQFCSRLIAYRDKLLAEEDAETM